MMDIGLECYKNLFPESKITINYKVKEKTVSNFIKETFPDYNWIFDKVIKNGISKRRPDVLLELSTHYIIVEIDEEQHSEYGYISESNRIKDIRKDIDYKDVVFIRFNTDSYTNSDNIIIKSPWMYNKSNVFIYYKEDWNIRLEELKNTIQKTITTIPENNVSEIKLFYNLI
jgi:hypothetical protein